MSQILATRLNQLAAALTRPGDMSGMPRDEWPIELMNGRQRYGKTIQVHDPKLLRSTVGVETGEPDAEVLKELLSGDDYQLEYDEDGYPKLAACLDRKGGQGFRLY